MIKMSPLYPPDYESGEITNIFPLYKGAFYTRSRRLRNLGGIALPDDFWANKIFPWIMDPQSLGLMRRVCKSFHKLLSEEKCWNKFNLSQLFPKVIWLNQFWDTLHVQRSPVSKMKIIPVLMSLANETLEISVLSIPKNFSFQELQRLNRDWGNFLELINMETKEPKERDAYTLVIGTGKQSKWLYIGDHWYAAQERNFQLPDTLEICTMLFIKSVCKSLYPKHPIPELIVSEGNEPLQVNYSEDSKRVFIVGKVSYYASSSFCGVIRI